MFSVLMSKIELGFPLVEEKMKKYIGKDSKVVIIPWSFPNETNEEGVKEYFESKIKSKYVLPLLNIGVKEKNINYLNCYSDTFNLMKKSILNSDVLVLTGGNPEMFYNKVKTTGLFEIIKEYDKIIIGSSAGAELQLEDYFITAKNNYYKKFDWYKGFGVIDNSFYFDVHSLNDEKYLSQFNKIAKEKNKNVYAIFDDGVIICNRQNGELELFGNVMTFSSKKTE